MPSPSELNVFGSSAEVKFPTALHDCIDAVKHIIRHSNELRIDADQLVVSPWPLRHLLALGRVTHEALFTTDWWR